MSSPSNTTGIGDTPLKDLSYEQAFLELETIVTALESGERPLEEALAFYERGQALARYCADLLDQAELKVSQLSGEQIVDYEPPD